MITPSNKFKLFLNYEPGNVILIDFVAENKSINEIVLSRHIFELF